MLKCWQHSATFLFALHFIDCGSFRPTQCQEPRQWDHFTILLMVNINFCVGGGCKSNPGPVYTAGVWIHLSVWRKAHKRLFDFYVHNRATHVTTKAFSDATETAVGSSNSLPTFHFAPFFFLHPILKLVLCQNKHRRYKYGESTATHNDNTNQNDDFRFLPINGLWKDLFEGYICTEKLSNSFLIHTIAMFTVLKVVALRLCMWNISFTLESPKQWLATRLNTACTLCLPIQLCVGRVSPFHSVQQITFTTCATAADIYTQVPDFEEELNLRQHIVFAP